jgi:TRAP-type mannitol/chloroaromatic compound transport system substrate-binding protein
MTLSRRHVLTGGFGALAMPAIAQAPTGMRWRCVTSWSRNLTGPGVTIQRLARRVNEMSQGALVIDVFAAGEIVPALAIFDAVSSGVVETGHTAALFWQGKMPAASVFTTVPFGLSPAAHAGWLGSGGQVLWDELYAQHGVKPFLAGNTGPSTAGWFRKPVQTIDDLAGLRIRVTGLGGEVYRRAGATPIVISPGETYQSLERGLIDAAEFLAPANDIQLGLHRVAPHLGYPGFNKPNGASEFLVSDKVWRDLPRHLQAIVEAACRAEHDLGLSEAASANAAALRQVIAEGALPFRMPVAVLQRLQQTAQEAVASIGDKDDVSRRIQVSYTKALENGRGWDAMTRLRD